MTTARRNLNGAWCAAACAAASLLVPAFPALALGTYRSAWMTSWSGCECGGSSLDYTDDQINYFNSEMDSHGGTRLSTFANTNVWASDVAEDYGIGGQDYLYSDDVMVWAYSGHGIDKLVGGAQHLSVNFCKKGTVGSCNLDMTVNTKMGEQSPLYYATPYPGSNRWMLMATCRSVHTNPDQQWAPNMQYGTEFVIGFRGDSTDSTFTDDFLGDFVHDAFAPDHAFKGEWFNAVDDFWIDDTGEVIANGPSAASAASRRDGYNSNTYARRPWGDPWNYYAWSWHQG